MTQSVQAQTGYPLEFDLMIAAISVLILLYCFIGYFVSYKRNEIFPGSFLKTEILEKTDPPFRPATNGYPDQGSGLYSEKLEFKPWFEFNTTQRVHHNFQEWLPIFLVACLLCTLSYPIVATCFAFWFVLARVIYTVGYRLHPKSRAVGALMFILGSMVLLVVVGVGFYTIYSKDLGSKSSGVASQPPKVK